MKALKKYEEVFLFLPAMNLNQQENASLYVSHHLLGNLLANRMSINYDVLRLIHLSIGRLPSPFYDVLNVGLFQEVNESPETLRYVWYPELEIYGLETFGRQSVLKEMSGVRVMKNKTINYELG